MFIIYQLFLVHRSGIQVESKMTISVYRPWIQMERKKRKESKQSVEER